MKNYKNWLTFSFLLVAVCSFRAAETAVDDNFRLAAGLVRQGLPEYGIEVLKRKGLENTAAGKTILFQIHLHTGDFSGAKSAITKLKDQDELLAWKMRLDLAHAYFTWGQTPKCETIYESFFKAFPDGPSAESNLLYREAAYRYAQTLRMIKEDKRALAAYRNVLKAKLEKHEKRQVLAEIGELSLKLAEKTREGNKEAYLKDVENICDKLVWERDVWFGKAIVMLAHVKLLRGDSDAAQEILEDNMETLEEIHKILLDHTKAMSDT